MIGQCAPSFENTRQKFGRDDHLGMLVRNVEKDHTCVVFPCMQLASTIGGPQSAHRSRNFAIHFFHEWILAFLVIAKALRHHIFPPYMKIKDSLLYSLMSKEGAAKITAVLRQAGLMRMAEVYLSPNEIGGMIGGLCSMGKVKKRVGVDPIWFVITPVDPETKVPRTDQARCSELITAICMQLQEFGAMTFDTAVHDFGGWAKEAKSNGRVIIEGKRASEDRASAKGKFWELRASTTKLTGVKQVDMEMYEEFTKNSRATSLKRQSQRRKRDEIK
jgi:hypothetical protein